MHSRKKSARWSSRLVPGLLALLGFRSLDVVAGTLELFQARNGTPAMPQDPVEWVKGNATEANSHYVEGFSVPYRVVITDVAAGHHYLVLEWDTLHNGKHAIDYLTHYDRLQPHSHFGAHSIAETINPLSGLAGTFGAAATFPIPAPSTNGSAVAGQPALSFKALPGENRAITIWNATITNATYVQELSLGGDSAASRLRIDFIADGGTVVVAFGGHIASKLDWGAGNSAASIPGAPYHMRLISFDGGGGNQDRAVQALAVGSPPTSSLEGPAVICAASTNLYSVITDAGEGALYRWSLANNTSGAAIVGTSDGSTVLVASGSPGSFDIEVVVSANGLMNDAVRTISVNAITAATGLFDQTACQGSAVAFHTSPSGTGPFNFVWRKADTVITGQTNAVLTIDNVSAAHAGTYCVEVSGACGTVTNCAALAITSPPMLVCPSNVAGQCFAEVPLPTPELVATTGGSGTVNVIHGGDIAVTNDSEILITRIYRAIDGCGIEGTCQQTIRVQDTIAPTILCPSSFAVIETIDGAGSAVVSFASAATDNCDMVPAIVCNPSSGSALPVGTHAVACVATDASRNETACSFSIKVVPRVIIASNPDDSGPNTLRQALLDANAALGSNVIRFAFPGEPPYTIQLLSPLPELSDTVFIDGWSQLQFTGVPVIEVNGTTMVVPVPESGANSTAGGVGFAIRAAGTVVRGLTLNGFETGIRVDGPGGNVIQGNLIGTDVSGRVALPNLGDGIIITSPGNLVGGDSAWERNVIAGNGGSGIVILGTNATSNVVRGNYIGLAADGTSPLGNSQNGMRLGNKAADNLIGGRQPGQGNSIAFNGGAGVLLDPDAGSGNLILGNSIYSNGGLAIDLGGEGSTANDVGDPDDGPNGLQNAPVLSTARSLDGNTTVLGLAEGSPNSTLLLEFFLNSAPDGSTSPPLSLGTKTVTTDANGEQSFSASFAIAATALQSVTATSTDAGNNTSEFAQEIQVQTPPMIVVQPASAQGQLGSTVTFCVTAIGTPPLLYQWRLNGANVPGATNPCLTIPNVQLANGGSYTVVIGNDLGTVFSEQAQLSFVFGDGVVGDNFADRVRLINANGIKSGNNSAATFELGEPLHSGKPGGRSVWYTWTPPGAGIATFSTEGSAFDTLLAVYTGSNMVALAAAARDEDSGGFYTSRHSFNVFDGETYQIAVDGFGGASGGFIISWTFEATHDLLPVITNQPISRTVASGSTVTFTVGAVGTCREIDHDCRHIPGESLPQRPDPRRVLTYQWFYNGTAIPGATNSTLTISNVQENVLGRYYAEVSDEGRTVRGETAHLQVNETGSFVQNVQATDKFLDALLSTPLELGGFAPNTVALVAEAKDDGSPFAANASTVVRGYTGTQVFNTSGSSTESGEASICGRVGGASQWIVYVAQESGTAFFNTDGSSYNTVMAAYARVPGSAVPQYVGCDDNGGLDGRDSAMIIPVLAGRTNLIVIDGVNGATGTLRLNYSLVTPTLLVPLGTTPEGDAHLRVSGRPELRFTIQRSGDFQNWSSIVFTNAASGVFDYIDPGSAALPIKAYRALLQP